ncbi:hypothetical protein [Candidatus Deferrimicrobium sp.]|uniref:hypothetical protein n=1 Tax=Candidatus Deferrimicrobium sp. TaxID=3060586 RepID=UPI003C65FA73
MTRTGGSASKGLGRRAFGTAGGRETSCEAPERSGEVIDLEEGILRKPVVPPVPRAWKPRAGRIYNFPVRILPDEK